MATKRIYRVVWCDKYGRPHEPTGSYSGVAWIEAYLFGGNSDGADERRGEFDNLLDARRFCRYRNIEVSPYYPGDYFTILYREVP